MALHVTADGKILHGKKAMLSKAIRPRLPLNLPEPPLRERSWVSGYIWILCEQENATTAFSSGPVERIPQVSLGESMARAERPRTHVYLHNKPVLAHSRQGWEIAEQIMRRFPELVPGPWARETRNDHVNAATGEGRQRRRWHCR